MKNLFLKSISLLALASFVSAQPVHASVVASLNQSIYDSTTNPTGGGTAFDGAISNSDLVEYGASSLSSFSFAVEPEGNNPDNVHDGLGGNNLFNTNYNPSDSGSGGSIYIVNESLPNTFTFALNLDSSTGGSTTGYDITTIQSIAGWNDNNDASQNLSISYQTLTSGGWVSLGTYNNALSSAYLGVSTGTQTLLTDSSSGAFLTNVTALQFTYDLNSEYLIDGHANATILHEIDVMGTASVPEPGTWAMLFAGCCALLFVSRFRKLSL